jgi:hypothetical protein
MKNLFEEQVKRYVGSRKFLEAAGIFIIIRDQEIGNAVRNPKFRGKFKERIKQVDTNAVFDLEIIFIYPQLVFYAFGPFAAANIDGRRTPATKYMRLFFRRLAEYFRKNGN